jgi:GxxExxY protein
VHITQQYLDDLTYKIIGCAIEVHKELGPGLLESVYQKCFVRELLLQHMDFISQTLVPISYKGMLMEADLRLDVLVENLILVELKAMDNWLPVHEAQV